MKRPGFIGALNAAIAAGFVLSAVCFVLSLFLPLPRDTLIALLLGGRDALDYLPDADRLRLRLVLAYGPTSAIAFFFVRRLTLSYLQSAVLFACNALLVYSIWTRYWLAVEDGAVLAKMFSGADLGWAVFLTSTALALLEWIPIAVISAVLVVAFAKRTSEPKPAPDAPSGGRWVAAAQMAVVALAAIAPVAYWTVKLGGSDDSPGAMGDAKAARFEALCATTRIEIRRKATDAKGVVFLRPLGAEVGLLKRLQFVEVELDQPRFGMPYLEYSRAGKTPIFLDGQFTGGEGPVPESRAEYEVSRTRLEAASAPEYAFHSAEHTIRDRRTDEVIARYSYVMEDGNGPRRFCPRGFGGEEFRSHMVHYVFGAMEPEKAAWMEKQLADFRKTATK